MQGATAQSYSYSLAGAVCTTKQTLIPPLNTNQPSPTTSISSHLLGCLVRDSNCGPWPVTENTKWYSSERSQTVPVSPSGRFKFEATKFVDKLRRYTRITSTKCPLFCITTFSASLRVVTALLPQPQDWSSYVLRTILTLFLLWFHIISRTLRACGISLGSLTLPAPEARVFIEFLLL
jgi:hypothetical protein